MNATAASLLGLLDHCGGELTGGELVRVAQQRIGEFWSLTRSQVYRELAALEREGYVEPGTPGPRESRPVRVTEAGREVYRTWLVEHLPGDTIRIPLLLAVALGRSLPADRLDTLLTEAEAEHRAKLETYRRLQDELVEAGADAYARATLSFGLHYEEAVLRWFASLPREVRGGTPPVSPRSPRR